MNRRDFIRSTAAGAVAIATGGAVVVPAAATEIARIAPTPDLLALQGMVRDFYGERIRAHILSHGITGGTPAEWRDRYGIEFTGDGYYQCHISAMNG